MQKISLVTPNGSADLLIPNKTKLDRAYLDITLDDDTKRQYVIYSDGTIEEEETQEATK